MPGPLTHVWFATRLQEITTEVFPFLTSYYDFYKVGSLGPDPFFFYKGFSLPSEQKRNVNLFGKKLHLQHPMLTFKPWMEIITKRLEDKNQYMAYFLGFLTHYILDRCLHPYVFYWSGFDDEGGLDTLPFKYDHIRFEHSVDLAVMMKQSLTIDTYNPSFVLSVNEDVLATIETMYLKAYENGNAFQASYQRMMQGYNFLYPLKDWKRKMLGYLVSKRSYLYSMTHDRVLSPLKFDIVTNTRRHTWLHPSTGLVQDVTVFDLMNTAESEFMELLLDLKVFFHAFEPQNIQAKLLEKLSDVNFDGDKPFEIKRYYKSIYPSFGIRPTHVHYE